MKCAIVGATGLVGRKCLEVLEERKIDLEYFLYASYKSNNMKINFNNKEYIVETLNKENISKQKFDFALFFAGSKVSEEYAKEFTKNNTIVIDNSSYFRMQEDVPLVVPEVNICDVFNKKIIANPNCSTIQEVIILNALLKFKIKRVIISTYQAVSGAGKDAILDLQNEGSDGYVLKKFTSGIKNNCIPHIDYFCENDYTFEEMKMVNETKKILHDKDLKISTTCVRVPVTNCHSESINIEFFEEIDINDIKKSLSTKDSIVVLDSPLKQIYPINSFVNNKDCVFVGRIRRDYSSKNAINLWCVADNLRKGAATNAVQILEKLLNT